MKEIGEKLKETREGMGISIEEASEDLKLRPSQIQNIEEGNMEAFQDILYLKYFIRDYAKYLGLNQTELVDEFNEYLFDYTSKLSLDDIKKEVKSKKEENTIHSPYTVKRKSEKRWQIITYIAIILLLIIICYLLYTIATNGKTPKDEEHILKVGGIYELT